MRSSGFMPVERSSQPMSYRWRPCALLPSIQPFSVKWPFLTTSLTNRSCLVLISALVVDLCWLGVAPHRWIFCPSTIPVFSLFCVGTAARSRASIVLLMANPPQQYSNMYKTTLQHAVETCCNRHAFRLHDPRHLLVCGLGNTNFFWFRDPILRLPLPYCRGT